MPQPSASKLKWTIEEFDTWPALIKFYELHAEAWKKWVFRGQGSVNWRLETSFERATRRFGISSKDRLRVERGLIRRFRREAHHYCDDVPSDGDLMGWLALMQHYGAPTRLLDFTYSFYIALFFAIERASPGDTVAIWALDGGWLREEAINRLPAATRSLINNDARMKNPKTVRRFLRREPPVSLVIPLNPFIFNERLMVQQGVFLAIGDVSKSFDDNLLVGPSRGEKRSVRIQIHCVDMFLKSAIRHLHRMNISRATLFRGLDGLAMQLGNLIAIPETIPPDTQ